jgi:hypothetical protein
LANTLNLLRQGGRQFIGWLGELLKVVRQLVSRLVELDVICARDSHYDDAAVLALLDKTSELRSLRPQLGNRGFDIVAHQSDRVMTRVIVVLALPLAMRRVNAHLARTAFEDEPIIIKILSNVLQAEHVT